MNFVSGLKLRTNTRLLQSDLFLSSGVKVGRHLVGSFRKRYYVEHCSGMLFDVPDYLI
jgi:hypothetical protein